MHWFFAWLIIAAFWISVVLMWPKEEHRDYFEFEGKTYIMTDTGALEIPLEEMLED